MSFRKEEWVLRERGGRSTAVTKLVQRQGPLRLSSLGVPSPFSLVNETAKEGPVTAGFLSEELSLGS